MVYARATGIKNQGLFKIGNRNLEIPTINTIFTYKER